jgi:spore photoproduct lyase
MSKTIFIESACLEDAKAKRYLAQYPNADVIACDHYKSVFNPKSSQNFRLQKQNPAMIIAQKEGKRVHPTPESFGIGSHNNYYFSHLLNCPYDCRYCFLQGMYPSAHYVWFVNYLDFMQDIKAIAKAKSNSYFFSGYDGDSLALDKQTQFLECFIPFFQGLDDAKMEIRTKSALVEPLLKFEASEHIVCAFSLSPDIIIKNTEHRTASLEKRLQAIKKCAEHGWPIGLRFDPVIYFHNYEQAYRDLIDQVFKILPKESIHSISVGPMRFPKDYFNTIKKLYPDEPLFAQYFENNGNVLTYPQDIEAAITQAVIGPLLDYGVSEKLLFRCYA